MSSRRSLLAALLRRPLALAVTVTAAGLALAAPPRPDPLDARQAAPPPVHRSPLDGFRRLPEVLPPEGARWREGNETVNRIGGWRAYARESAAAAAAAEAAASAPPRGTGERR